MILLLIFMMIIYYNHHRICYYEYYYHVYSIDNLSIIMIILDFIFEDYIFICIISGLIFIDHYVMFSIIYHQCIQYDILLIMELKTYGSSQIIIINL